MADEPDLNFDIDALFDHMINNLDRDLDAEMDWSFSLRADDLKVLEEVALELEDEFIVQIQDTVEEVDIDGQTTLGPPLLSIIRRAALMPDEVKAIANRIGAIAAERGAVYEGVSCYEPFDGEEIFGWFAPDDAAWRLRNLTDGGLEPNAELPWTFLILTNSLDSLTNIAQELTAAGFDDRVDYDEADDTGDYGICVFVAGRNNESDLEATRARISEIAERHAGRLEGIQFYTREDMEDVFGEEDDV